MFINNKNCSKLINFFKINKLILIRKYIIIIWNFYNAIIIILAIQVLKKKDGLIFSKHLINIKVQARLLKSYLMPNHISRILLTCANGKNRLLLTPRPSSLNTPKWQIESRLVRLPVSVSCLLLFVIQNKKSTTITTVCF